ncbi:hypothetical protein GQ41_4251 [Arenibacter algicola]|uniref:Uncharacterized protein n=1 Tax=Arenibacter algicola TaxID=616991 RepID=A0ABY3AFL3_9FLAO
MPLTGLLVFFIHNITGVEAHKDHFQFGIVAIGNKSYLEQ